MVGGTQRGSFLGAATLRVYVYVSMYSICIYCLFGLVYLKIRNQRTNYIYVVCVHKCMKPPQFGRITSMFNKSQSNDRLVNQKKVTCQQCHACFYFWKSLNVAPAWCFFWACFVIMNLANMFIIVEFQPLHLHFFIFVKTHEKHKKLNPQDYVWGHSKPQSVYVTVYSFLGPRPCRLLRRTCPVLVFFFGS